MIPLITGNLWRAATIALCGLAAALLVQIHGLPLIGGGLLSDLSAERTAHAETQKRYAMAQLDAAAKARAYRLSEEARYRAKSQRIENEHAQKLGSALAAADRHVERNRCLRPKASASAGGGTGAVATGGSAESSDRPGADAFMVAVTPDDVRTCTTNTQRLIDARSWALSINEGE